MLSERDVQPTHGMAIGLYLGAPLALLVALAQAALVHDIRLLGIKPNLLLLLVVAWVLLSGFRQGLLLALIGGVVLEVNSGAAFGTILLALLAAIGVAGLGEVNVFRGAWVLKYVVILGATLLYGLLSVALLCATAHPTPLGAALGRVILPEMAVHLLLMPPIYGALHALTRYLEPKPMEL
jgi:rod shape-determining protein MreD